MTSTTQHSAPASADPQPRKRLPASKRRESILAAATQAFADHGYHETSLDDIAAAAGVSKALIYDHFASKRDLQAELLESLEELLIDRLTEAATGDNDPEARLRAGLNAFFSLVEENRFAQRMLFRDAGQPEVADLFRRVRAEVVAVVGGLLAREPLPEGGDQFTERERTVVIEAFAQLLTGTAQSIADWWQDRREIPREVVVELVMGFAWLGLDRVRRGERTGY